MTESAYVRSIGALRSFRLAMSAFDQSASESLEAVNREINDTYSWLADRCDHWRGQAEWWQDQVRSAEDSLSYCRNSGDGETEPDCGYEERELEEAQGRLRQVNENLATAEREMRHLQDVVREYDVYCRRFKNALTEDLPAAQTQLVSIINALDRYVFTPVPLSSAAGQIDDTPLIEPLRKNWKHIKRHASRPKSANPAVEHSWFSSEGVLKRLTAHVISEKSATIGEWARDAKPGDSLVLEYHASDNTQIGTGVYGGGAPIPLYHARVVLQRDTDDWHVDTAYPVHDAFGVWGETRRQLVNAVPSDVSNHSDERLPIDNRGKPRRPR